MKKIVSFNKNEMDFIKQANNGNQDKKEISGKKSAQYYTIELTERQRALLDKIFKMTGLSSGDLVWHAVSVVNNLKSGITMDFFRAYSFFVMDKIDRKQVTFYKKMSSYEDLEKLKDRFKSEGFRIGLRGAFLLCILKYAEIYLKLDISEYKNFN